VQEELKLSLHDTLNNLRDSKEKYRKLFDEAIDAIFLADAKTGKLVDCNQAAMKLVGWHKSELIGKHQKMLHPKNGPSKFTKTFKQHLEEKNGETVETQIITKKGEIRDVAIKANVLELKGKKFLQGIFRDITERKKMEHKLRQERDILEAVTRNVGAGLTLIGRNYTILWSNDLLKHMYGNNLEQKFCYKKIHNRKKICVDCGVKKVFEGAESDTREFSYTDDTGNKVTFEIMVTPVKDDRGSVFGALELAIPITARKRMEQQVKASEKKFRAISNSVRDAIILVDDLGQIEYWNPAAEKTFGYPREEAMHREIHGLVVPQSMCTQGRSSIKKGLEQFRKTGTAAFMEGNIELIARRKNGEEFPLKLSLSPIMLNNKWHAVGVAKDITERKQKERIAREYAEKLERAVDTRTNELKVANENLLKMQRLATIGELAGMVGHDLRNPLTSIKNATYFMKKKGKTISEADSKDMLEIIEIGIKRSDKTINDLLDYARDEHLDLRYTSVKKVLEDALTMIGVPEKIKIEINVPERIALKMDTDKIERVFINLINNGIDAMPKGGTMAIHCKQVKNHIEMSFADTGLGISEEIRPKLFSPLVTTKAQGMGFGLAICKRIIEAHEGTISVETATGKGSTFKVTLPIERSSEVGGERVWIKQQESSLSTTTRA
jgi:PAS domain S-box-containing protein